MPRPMPTTAAEIAALIVAEPPPVTVSGIDSRDEHPNGVNGVLLVWGTYRPQGWAAGIAWIFSKTRGTAIQAMLTTWVPAETAEPWRHQDYSKVPRIQLHGPLTRWPQLPPIMPRVDKAWVALHLHTLRPDPAGEYRHLRDQMRAFRR